MADPAPQITSAAVTDAKAKWLASVPDVVLPPLGRELADKALADARAVILDVAFRYGGTIPPPPWPAPPELQRAIARMKVHRDGFTAVERAGPTRVVFVPAVRAAFIRDGGTLYDRAAELVAASDAAPKLPDLLKLIPDPRKLVMGLPVALVALGLWYLLERKGSLLQRL